MPITKATRHAPKGCEALIKELEAENASLRALLRRVVETIAKLVEGRKLPMSELEQLLADCQAAE